MCQQGRATGNGCLRSLTTFTTSLTKAQRAQENRAYVRRLLSRRQPAFAAALAAAERDISCPVCPREQREMAVYRSLQKVTGGSGVTHRRLLLVVRRLAGTPVLRRGLRQMLRIQAYRRGPNSLGTKPLLSRLTGRRT
jgi:hypothetical protein